MTARAKVVERRIDEAIGVEVMAVRVVAVRRGRPIVAEVTDIVETAIVVEAITRSRVPDGLVRTELAREVHAFVGVVVGIFKV